MCNCIADMQKALEESGKNTMLDIPIVIDRKTGAMKADKVMIATCKRDNNKREKPIKLFPSHCPFCGELYPRGD
jgi:spore coat polysaccharide biosynthesis protein SpsF (cytidylyltransferase family)